MITGLRLAAIACGIVYLSIGWIWAYWLALAALPVGALGYWLSVIAQRQETRLTSIPSRTQRVLAVLARWSNLAAFIASLVALVVTLAAN